MRIVEAEEARADAEVDVEVVARVVGDEPAVAVAIEEEVAGAGVAEEGAVLEWVGRVDALGPGYDAAEQEASSAGT